jgi:(R,R)-butanediol dehydrogenase/meso-butanediol dehydrogenase/diacetyl reductase
MLCDQLAAVGLMADGGLAELCNAPALTCLQVPASVSADAAALAETAAVAVRAVRRGRLRSGETVTVVGAGPVGLMAMQCARAMGAASVTVIDPLAERRSVAHALGATAAIHPDEAVRMVPTELALECSGHAAAIQTAIDSTSKRGRIVLVGIYAEPTTIQPLAVVVGERELLGSLAHVYDEDFRQALDLMATGAIKAEPLISDRLPLERAVEAGLEALVAEPRRHLKILVSPDLVP